MSSRSRRFCFRSLKIENVFSAVAKLFVCLTQRNYNIENAINVSDHDYETRKYAWNREDRLDRAGRVPSPFVLREIIIDYMHTQRQ